MNTASFKIDVVTALLRRGWSGSLDGLWSEAETILNAAPDPVKASLALGDIFERERLKAFATMEEYAEIMRRIERGTNDGEDWKQG